MPFNALIMSFLLAGAPESATSNEPMKCETGPVPRIFGGTRWLVYSCSDQTSLVIVSEADNPASPFYFIVHKKDQAYRIYGEGNGNKKVSDLAGDEISRLSEAELTRLLAETKAK